MYEKGYKVKIVSGIKYPQNGEYYISQNISLENVLTIKDKMYNKINGWYYLFEEENTMGIKDKWAFEFQLELLNKDLSKVNKDGQNMSIQEKFVLAFKSEPEKTFRKTGITNGDDLLTDEGQKVFLSWLLKKNQDEFKKEVADEILADIENEKKVS